MKRALLLVILSLILAPFTRVMAATSLNTGDLIKASGQAVYYYASNGKRLVFPNEKTYFTWYGDFSNVKTITDAELAAISIGGNVTYRPGKFLVKITTDPKVYAVDVTGSLRWVTSEAIAVSLYGSDWAKKVQDVPDAFFVDYTNGTPITNASDYNPSSVMAQKPTISTDVTPTTPVSTEPAIDRGIVKTSTVNVDDLFRITIDSNPTTGYVWKPTFDSAVFTFVTSTYVAPTSTAYGVAGTERFDFKALKQSAQSDIVFDYVRPWETGAAPAERRTFRMIVNSKPLSASDVTLNVDKTEAQAGETINLSASTTIANPKSIRLTASGTIVQECTSKTSCNSFYLIPTAGTGSSYDFSAVVTSQDGTSVTTTKTVTIVTTQTLNNLDLIISKPIIRPNQFVDITVNTNGVINVRDITIIVDSTDVKRCENSPTTCKFSNKITGSVGSSHTTYAILTSNAGLKYQTVKKTISIAANDAPSVTVLSGRSFVSKTDTVDIAVTANDDDGIASMSIMQGNTVIKTCQGPAPCTAYVGPFPTFSSGDSLRYYGIATDLLGQSASSSQDAVITIL